MQAHLARFSPQLPSFPKWKSFYLSEKKLALHPTKSMAKSLYHDHHFVRGPCFRTIFFVSTSSQCSMLKAILVGKWPSETLIFLRSPNTARGRDFYSADLVLQALSRPIEPWPVLKSGNTSQIDNNLFSLRVSHARIKPQDRVAYPPTTPLRRWHAGHLRSPQSACDGLGP
jgi:hypothetical protein